MLEKGRGRLHRTLGLIPAIAVAAAAATLGAVPAYAHCHYFTVSVNPGSVNEGGGTTATVSRDGAVAPSSVHLDTADGTAVAGRDYVAIHQTVSFTGGDLSMAIPVGTIHNPAHEGSQAFRLQLSGGGGCSGAGYVYGSPATVTIMDIDPGPTSHPPTQPPATMAPQPAATTAPPAATSAPTPAPVAVAPSSTPSPDASPSSSATPALYTTPTSSGGSGGPLPLVLGAIVVLALGGAGFYWYRRRSGG